MPGMTRLPSVSWLERSSTGERSYLGAIGSRAAEGAAVPGLLVEWAVTVPHRIVGGLQRAPFS